MTPQGQRYTVYELLVSPSPIFQLFRSTASRFWVTGHYETSAPNDPQMTLRSNAPRVCATSVSESQLSVCFALRPAFLELQAILRQVHWMTPKWPWTLQGQLYSIYVLLVSVSTKLHSLLLYMPLFRYKIVEIVKNPKCTEWHENGIEHLTIKNIWYTRTTYPHRDWQYSAPCMIIPKTSRRKAL